MLNIVILASGSGSNAENLIQFFQSSHQARISAVLTNNPNAGVIARTKRLKVPTEVFNREVFTNSQRFHAILDKYRPDILVLAGFLWLIPATLINKFPERIVNIHPALLPKFGGKGMYGENVHKAVLQSGETEHGVTVHLVNEEYDKGEILLQERFAINDSDSLASVTAKIHEIEFRLYPKAIQLLLSRISEKKA